MEALSSELREMEVREPLAIESVVEGVWRKMRAWVEVTRAIERWGCSRRRTRMDMVIIGLVPIVRFLSFSPDELWVARSDAVVKACWNFGAS